MKRYNYTLEQEDMCREFENGELAIRVSDYQQIDVLKEFLNENLFLDTTVLYAKSLRGVYNNWFKDNQGDCLVVGYWNNMCEALSQEYANNKNMHIVDFKDFMPKEKKKRK